MFSLNFKKKHHFGEELAPESFGVKHPKRFQSASMVFLGEILQIYHAFALFGPPRNMVPILMIPVLCHAWKGIR